MSNTKIVVLRSKEVITAAIFVGIAVIVLFVLLGFLFTGKNDSKTTAQSNGDQKYEAGVYTKELTIGDSVVNLQLSLDEDRVKAVEFVKAYHYLDDEEYVRRYIEKNANKKSKKQMTGELYQKGITAEILDRGFEDMPVNEEEQILAIAKKRGFDAKMSSPEEKRKLFSYLARKGFSYDRIRTALDCRELWEND